jgi:diadenosine tetraphosphatase ApaH/serine/threonine PP2A family protein phosphatase
VVDIEVPYPKVEAHGESPSIFQLIDQLENVTDKLLAGYDIFILQIYQVNKPRLWIRIRIGSGFRDFLDPDPYWESGFGSGSRGKKTKKFHWKNALFSYLKKNFTTKKV